MSRLSHVVAVHKSVKSAAAAGLTKAHHTAQASSSLTGISRTYQPLKDDELGKPPESTRVRYTAQQILDEVKDGLTRLFDVEATVDFGNTIANADVVVNGHTLIENTPVSYLLFLEKQLVDIGTFIKKLPVLDAADSWEFDANTGHYRTEPVQTTSTKKVYRNHVKAEATKEHAAQVEVFVEDGVVGHWSTVKFSGAFPATRVKQLSDRVTALQEAVKVAREQANATEVQDMHPGTVVLGWLFS